jgi:hypothetical protein
MNQKKKGMSPIMKGGMACCALLALLIAGACGLSVFYADELAKWAGNMATTDGPKTAARYKTTVGVDFPEDVAPKFSMDMSPLPMTASFGSTKDPNTLTLIAVDMPADESQPIPEHQIAWEKVVGAFAPQMQQFGVDLPTAEALRIKDTGPAEEKELEVDGKKFKIVVIPCQHSNKTELKRVYVKLKGGGFTGLFAVGSKADFDDDLLEDALKGATPR